MKRIKVYEDQYLTVTDCVDSGELAARRIVMKNEYGSIEKEYHKVFMPGMPAVKGAAENDNHEE